MTTGDDNLVATIIRRCLLNPETRMMQLATCADNQPWLCNVWFVADDDLRIYWFSATNRRHSKEIARNPQVAATICKPQAPTDPAIAVQIAGVVHELSEDSDMALARKVYEGVVFTAKQIDDFMSNPDRPHRFYRLDPTEFVLFDTIDFPENSRREWRPN